MKKFLKVIGITIFSLAVLMGLITMLSHIIWHRSLTASIAEMVLLSSMENPSEGEIHDNFAELLKTGPEIYQIPDDVQFRKQISVRNVDGMNVYVLNEDGSSNISILYLHGGAYISGFSSVHWQLMDNLSVELDATVIAPDYQLAPYATYEDAYQAITAFYKSYHEENPERRFILMGDSAGGGLALGLAEYFVKENIHQPDSLILLSPWVDITMENPAIADYQDTDPMLQAETLAVYGRYWAGDTDPHDPMLSPIYGNMEGLPPVTLFVGTREIFYPDLIELNEKLLESGVEVNLIVGEGMNHIWPLYPIPEAEDAQEEILSAIKDKS